MGNTRDLLAAAAEISSKIRASKGIFRAKMGSIKDRNGMDKQKQKILKRGGTNTQKNYTKKVLMTQITTIMWLLFYSQTWSVKSSRP